MTRLYRVSAENSLTAISPSRLASEDMVHNWVEQQPELLGLDLLIIGREVPTGSGFIDFLGMDREGDLAVLELKRDKTPREVVTQVLDYASWVAALTTPEIIDIASAYLKQPVDQAFNRRFGGSLPEALNSSHKMVVIASAFDAVSERIVKYLSEHHGVEINTAFFNVFSDDTHTFLTTDWLLDESEVVQRSEARSKIKYSLSDLRAMAAERGTTDIVDTCRTLADQTKERPAPAYGGSLRYWYNGRIVFGSNIGGGRASPPKGELDVWVPVRTIAELAGISEATLRDSLRREFNAIGNDQQDEIIRLGSSKDARTLVDKVVDWLGLRAK